MRGATRSRSRRHARASTGMPQMRLHCRWNEDKPAADSELGCLRKALIDRLGLHAARDVLLRVAFVRGWQVAARKDATPDWFDVRSSSQPLTELGARLAGSFEAEQLLSHVG